MSRNSYELTVVYSPKLTEVKRKKTLKELGELVKQMKGKVNKKDDWGKKKLAYQIDKFLEGYFVHWQVDLEAEAPVALEKQLRLDETVLRYLLVRR